MNSKYEQRRRAFWISHALLTAFFAILLCVMIAAGQDVRADTAAWIVMLASHLVASALTSHVASCERTCGTEDEPPRRRAGLRELSEADWVAQRQAREAANATDPYISPANISATCVTLQPTEDGRELGDHGLILSVLAALRSADALPLPDRGVLKQLVYEMAYRFAADSGMEERDRRGILDERKAETRMDAYANHCQGIQELRAAQAASENASALVSTTAIIDAYALRVDEFARRSKPGPAAEEYARRVAEMASAPPTDGAQFVHNPNSPKALDALLDAAGAPDPRDMGDALAYSFVGLDPAKPGSDRTVFAISLADKAPCEAMHMFLIERARQIQAEGCKPEHDDGYIHGELARAAATYAMPEEYRPTYIIDRDLEGVVFPTFWPWGEPSWKPTPNDRLREVVKAGALLLAEAERLIRARPPG